MTTLVIDNLIENTTLDRAARARVLGGGEPQHTSSLPFGGPLGSEPRHSSSLSFGEPLSSEPSHSFRLGF